jgi:hypothetical protein
MAASAPSGLANSLLASDSLLAEGCSSERAALDRLRKDPSAEAAGRSLRGPAASGQPAAGKSQCHARAARSGGYGWRGDPVVCRQEMVELNRIRATPDLIDAKRFASAMTCDALKPQTARLLESLRE